MKHYYIEHELGAPAVGMLAGATEINFPLLFTEDVDELDVPGRLYLGSTDDDGNSTTALIDRRDSVDVPISLSSFTPFFQATLRIGDSPNNLVPCVIHRDHVAMSRPAGKDRTNAMITLGDGLSFFLEENHGAIGRLLLGDEEDDAPATP